MAKLPKELLIIRGRSVRRRRPPPTRLPPPPSTPPPPPSAREIFKFDEWPRMEILPPSALRPADGGENSEQRRRYIANTHVRWAICSFQMK
ncbi:hypothetical protein GWI33_015738 [Rhynchophorus ferrugineus]|uniref:Uncharacterized protein n=1 Tax=Rhynchophorus ferrugineus TaxID=354439 RepID=A0A834I287_RHYFE|nr:hypothetical protein GWI33_015738 [Rhynchophorus ferrugineus]